MKIYNNKMRRLRSVNLQIMMAKNKKIAPDIGSVDGGRLSLSHF